MGEWYSASLGNFVRFQKGVSYKGEYLDKPGLRLLGLGTIVPGGGIMLAAARQYCGPVKPHQQIQPGEVYVALTDITQDGRVLGSPALLPNNAHGGYAVTHHVAKAVIRRPDDLDKTFLYYLLKSEQARAYFRGVASGTTVRAVSAKDAENLEIQLPPLSEQRKIASILSALDDKIELNRRMNATLEAMARALFQSWFVDFDPVRAKAEGLQPVGMDAETAALFPDSFEDSALGPIPKGWAVWTLGQLCEFEYGKPLKAEDRKGGTIPVYGAGGQIGWHDKPLVSGPGVIVGRKGNPGVVTWSQSDFYPIDTAFYVKAKDSDMSAYMLFQILSGLDLSRLSVDSGVPGLNRHHAYMSPLVVAPRRILQAFDAHARTLGVELANKINSSRSLSEMRELLLPRLLSGELRVGDIAA